MIQRIQSVYYAIAIIALILPMAGMEIFSFVNNEMTMDVTLFGSRVDEVTQDMREVSLPQMQLFWGNLFVITLLVLTIFSYKKLKRQAALGRFTMIVYLLAMVVMCLCGYFISQWLLAFQLSLVPGIGFYIMLSAIIFIWLGNRGVKKDRKLLDSLNRLR